MTLFLFDERLVYYLTRCECGFTEVIVKIALGKRQHGVCITTIRGNGWRQTFKDDGHKSFISEAIHAAQERRRYELKWAEESKP